MKTIEEKESEKQEIPVYSIDICVVTGEDFLHHLPLNPWRHS